jgi:uncharacterized protein YjcR
MRRRHPRRRISLRRVRLLPAKAKLAQVAFILGVSPSTVRNWMKGGLRAGRGRTYWEIHSDDLERYLRATHRLIG